MSYLVVLPVLVALLALTVVGYMSSVRQSNRLSERQTAGSATPADQSGVTADRSVI